MKIGDLITFNPNYPTYRNKSLGVIFGHEKNKAGRRFYRVAWNNPAHWNTVYVGDVELVNAHTGDHK